MLDVTEWSLLHDLTSANTALTLYCSVCECNPHSLMQISFIFFVLATVNTELAAENSSPVTFLFDGSDTYRINDL